MKTDDGNPVKNWWARNPMTYGSLHGTTVYRGQETELGSKEFFERLDEAFYYSSWVHHGERKFDRIFPYDEYGKGKRVLEIGCGLGTMAMHWARNGASVTAVDLNATSIRQTMRRFELFGLQGDIRQMDATSLEFDEDSFDYVYSWGVLHHSPRLAESLREMMRVLRKGGRFGLMLYNRDSIMYRYKIRYLEGFLHYENRFAAPLELASRYTDGGEQEGNPHTWPVTDGEIRDLLSPFSGDLKFRRWGREVPGIFKYMLPGVERLLPRWVKRTWSRNLGWSTWAYGHKKQE